MLHFILYYVTININICLDINDHLLSEFSETEI